MRILVHEQGKADIRPIASGEKASADDHDDEDLRGHDGDIARKVAQRRDAGAFVDQAHCDDQRNDQPEPEFAQAGVKSRSRGPRKA